MCCFCLHFADFNVLFFQKIKILQFTFEKITCCAKGEKKITCREKKSQPPWISNGPSLTCVFRCGCVCACVRACVCVVCMCVVMEAYGFGLYQTMIIRLIGLMRKKNVKKPDIFQSQEARSYNRNR